MLIYLNMVKCYMEKKDYDKAIELCKYVTEKKEDQQLWNNRISIWKSKKKINESIKAFEDSLMENPDFHIKQALKEI